MRRRRFIIRRANVQIVQRTKPYVFAMLPALFSGVFGASLTSYLAYEQWSQGRALDRVQQVQETRAEIIADVTRIILRYKDLKASSALYEQAVYEKGTEVPGPLTLEQANAINIELRQAYAVEYARLQQREHLLPEMAAALYRAQFYFGPKTVGELQAVANLLSKSIEYFLGEVSKEMLKRGELAQNVGEVRVPSERVAQLIRSEYDTVRERLTEAMRQEIGIMPQWFTASE